MTSITTITAITAKIKRVMKKVAVLFLEILLYDDKNIVGR